MNLSHNLQGKYISDASAPGLATWQPTIEMITKVSDAYSDIINDKLRSKW